MEKKRRKIRADDSIQKSETEEELSGRDEYDKRIMHETIEYLLKAPETGSELIAAGNGSETSRTAVLLKAKSLLANRKIAEDRIFCILEKMKKFLWGYYILEELIEDENVSDIRVMRSETVSANYNGVYRVTDIRFESEEEYDSFLQSIAVMNQISLADINALQVVTDKRSSPDWILRIAIATGYINSAETYFMQIRKHPRVKRSFERLLEMGMIPEEMAGYLKSRVGKGLLVAGQTGSGKTHFLNAMIDLIPQEMCGLCVQEAEELFSSNTDSLIAYLHVVEKKGEGKIRYDLEELSKFGLLTSNKYFIIGEIKGNEAAYFSNACYTGSIAWTTVHAESSSEATDKLTDYVMRATGYDYRFVQKMLKTLETVVFMKDYKIMEISELDYYDGEKGRLVYREVYRRKEGWC